MSSQPTPACTKWGCPGKAFMQKDERTFGVSFCKCEVDKWLIYIYIYICPSMPPVKITKVSCCKQLSSICWYLSLSLIYFATLVYKLLHAPFHTNTIYLIEHSTLNAVINTCFLLVINNLGLCLSSSFLKDQGLTNWIFALIFFLCMCNWIFIRCQRAWVLKGFIFPYS